MTESNARLGGAVELRYLGGDVDKVKLSYKIADEYIPNENSEYAENCIDLQGIKRYNIFRYFEEINMLLPVVTEFDEESNTLYAETDELGTYCVLDMEVVIVNGEITPPYNLLAKKSDIYATKTDLLNNHARFILIGHSNGGLVSRYYIENHCFDVSASGKVEKCVKGNKCANCNTNGSVNVDKLITIDTPHYGSGWAYPSAIAMLAGHTLGMAVPLDIELRPNSSLFTGQKLDTDSIGVWKGAMGSNAKERLNYIQENQSFKLNGNSYVDTQYYAIGGAIAYLEGDPFADTVYNAEFALKKYENISELVDAIDDATEIEITRIPSLSGDNIVELYSQFGLKVDGNSITEYVEFKEYEIFLTFKPFYKQYTPLNHFHGDILKNRQMQSVVLKYIRS